MCIVVVATNRVANFRGAVALSVLPLTANICLTSVRHGSMSFWLSHYDLKFILRFYFYFFVDRKLGSVTFRLSFSDYSSLPCFMGILAK